MTDITNIEASERVLAHLHEGRLVQGAWHRERDGRELACVLGAIGPKINDASMCPASVMPWWMSRLVVRMFDSQAKDAALAWAGRFGSQMARWHRLDDAAWLRVRESFCSAVVAEAQRSSDRACVSATDPAAAAADAARAAADAIATYADAAYAAARQACWTRLATALCDLIDAELEAAK
jgi:hypothetical protein